MKKNLKKNLLHKNKNRKCSFTLIELLMSLSLSAIIITLLLTFTFKLFLIERKIKIAKQEFLAEAELEIKLRSLFSELILDNPQNNLAHKTNNENNPKLKNANNSLDFYTDKKADRLCFLFNGHINPDPLFSGPLKGELFLDENKNLVLITRSLAEGLAPKTEVLAAHIQTLDFTFFNRKEAQYPGDKTYLAVSHWEEKEPPAIMQITIQKEDPLEIQEPQKKKNPLILTFFLDNMKSSLVCLEDQ